VIVGSTTSRFGFWD